MTSSKEPLVKTPRDSIKEYWSSPKENLSLKNKFHLYCEENPWDVECKIYEV